MPSILSFLRARYRAVLLGAVLLLAGASITHADTGGMSMAPLASSAPSSTQTLLPGAALYGSIAYDKESAAWGMSSAFAKKQDAIDDALHFCANYGKKCTTVMTVDSACVAIAQGEQGTIVWAKDTTAAKARSAAQTSCIEKSGDACDLKRWGCFFPVPSLPASK